MKNILVVKLSAIGDVIHALPVSYAIKETYPDAHLTWVVEPTAYPILEDNPQPRRLPSCDRPPPPASAPAAL